MYPWQEAELAAGISFNLEATSVGIGVKSKQNSPTLLLELAHRFEVKGVKTAVSLEAGIANSKVSLGFDFNLPLFQDSTALNFHTLVGYYWSKDDGYPRIGIGVSW